MTAWSPAVQVYWKATRSALWPLLAGTICALALSAYYLPEIENKTVFLVQRWLVITFVLNSAIIFWGTMDWAIGEFKHGGLGTLPSLLGALSLVVCGIELWSWRTFMHSSCRGVGSDCADVLAQQLHSSEFAAFGIFFLFLCIDSLAYWQIRSKPKADAHQRDFYRRCIWIVDLPVVIVVGVVGLSRGYLVNQSKQITDHGYAVLKDVVLTMQIDRPPLSIYGEVIGDSFAVGAILGHILLSQLAFAVLKWEYNVASLEKG